MPYKTANSPRSSRRARKLAPAKAASCFAFLRSSARKRGEKRGWRPAVLEEQGGILEDHMPGASSLEWRKLRHRGDHATTNLDARSPLEL